MRTKSTKKNVTIRLHETTHRELKAEAAKKGIPMSTLIELRLANGGANAHKWVHTSVNDRRN